MTDRHLLTDSVSGSLEYTGSEDVTVDSFEIDNAETVTLDSHWNDFFDTDEYLTFDATVAQPYIKNGKLRRDKKTGAEMKRVWIDKVSWIVGWRQLPEEV